MGTPTPAGAITIQSPKGGTDYTTEECVDSPEIERAEQATATHRMTCSWSNALAFLGVLPRGLFVRDTGMNVWRILSSKIKSLASGKSELSYTAESISFDSPPDDFQMTPNQLGIDITKHPRYSWALLPYVSDQSTFVTIGDFRVYYTDIKSSIMRAIQTYQDSPIYPNSDTINGLVQNSILSQIKSGKIQVTVPNPNFVPQFAKFAVGVTDISMNWDGTNAQLALMPFYVQNLTLLVPVNLNNTNDPIVIAFSAAAEIISKLWRREDTPYVVGFEMVWSQYFFAPVYENPGGYIEDPIGIVPDYFVSPTQDGTTTIFDLLAQYNPQCYSQSGMSGGDVDISWLRQADEVEYQRTWFKVTRKWIGSPIGHWDKDLYTQGPRPQNSNDFNVAV